MCRLIFSFNFRFSPSKVEIELYKIDYNSTSIIQPNSLIIPQNLNNISIKTIQEIKTEQEDEIVEQQNSVMQNQKPIANLVKNDLDFQEDIKPFDLPQKSDTIFQSKPEKMLAPTNIDFHGLKGMVNRIQVDHHQVQSIKRLHGVPQASVFIIQSPLSKSETSNRLNQQIVCINPLTNQPIIESSSNQDITKLESRPNPAATNIKIAPNGALKPKLRKKRNSSKSSMSVAPKEGNEIGNINSIPEYQNPFVYPPVIDHSKLSTRKSRSKEDNNYSGWDCILCKKIFSGKEELIDHYEEHRQEQLASGSSKQKTDKIQYHFRCGECSLDYFTYASYCNHNDLQHNKHQIKCPDCTKMCKNKMTLCLHLNDVHYKSINYKCTECTYECEMRTDLIKHFDCHDCWKYFCDHCDKVLCSSTMYQEHLRQHNGEYVFKCLWCDSSFVFSHSLMDHICENHSTETLELKCKQCDQVFGQQKSFIMHMRCHNGEENLCDTCGKPFRTKRFLRKHIMNTHKRIKSYPCTTCDKKFGQLNHLKVHMNSHTGEKPYKCNICDKNFSERSSLVRHRKCHSSETPFECPRCKKGFATRSIFNNHFKRNINCAVRKGKQTIERIQ